MAKDENGLHIQTEQELAIQFEHMAELGPGVGSELTNQEIADLQPPAWMVAD